MNQIENAALKLRDSWNAKAPYEALTGDDAPATIDDAYDIQAALQRLHSEGRGTIAGRKIALSSKTMQQMIGIEHPVAGAIFADDVLQSPAQVQLSDFVHLGLEFELAIELNSVVPPQTQAHTRDSVRDLVAGVRPAFELIEDRKADYAELDPFTLIADNAWCGGVVLGERLQNWQDLDLNNIPSHVLQDGQPTEETNTGAADPLGSLAWVLNHCSERGIELSRSEHIITGSAVQTRFPTAGDRFSYQMAGQQVSVKFV